MLRYLEADGNSPKHHAQCRHALILTQCVSELCDDILEKFLPKTLKSAKPSIAIPIQNIR